jgi:hypothetical protein
MTQDDLKSVLEQYTVCVIGTIMSGLPVQDQETLISTGIDEIVKTVMFCTSKKRVLRPSAN